MDTIEAHRQAVLGETIGQLNQLKDSIINDQGQIDPNVVGVQIPQLVDTYYSTTSEDGKADMENSDVSSPLLGDEAGLRLANAIFTEKHAGIIDPEELLYFSVRLYERSSWDRGGESIEVCPSLIEADQLPDRIHEDIEYFCEKYGAAKIILGDILAGYSDELLGREVSEQERDIFLKEMQPYLLAGTLLRILDEEDKYETVYWGNAARRLQTELEAELGRPIEGLNLRVGNEQLKEQAVLPIIEKGLNNKEV
jgi:hypothetical protein